MENRYAVFTMTNELDVTRERLERCNLKVVSVEVTKPAYAWQYFGIFPTKDVIEKLPYTSTIFVEGTEASFQKYCNTPENDIGEYWSKGA